MSKPLGMKLHDEIEKAQGYAYISDGLYDRNEKQIAEIVHNSIGWHLECVRVLRKFKKKHKLK